MEKISVTILTKNSEKYLFEVLNSLISFDEVIILDNGSTDKTIEILKEFSNTKLFVSEFIGFGNLKNLASTYATNEWILSIDSDEVVSKELANEILNLELKKDTIYSIKRLNHYNKKPIKCCGWYPDRVKRLYNKSSTKFNSLKVHESLISEGFKNITLQNDLIHYTTDGIEQMLSKMALYSSYGAENIISKNCKISSFTPILHFISAFLKNYFLKKGIFYGRVGFNISLLNSLGSFFKYAKAYELQNRKSDE